MGYVAGTNCPGVEYGVDMLGTCNVGGAGE